MSRSGLGQLCQSQLLSPLCYTECMSGWLRFPPEAEGVAPSVPAVASLLWSYSCRRVSLAFKWTFHVTTPVPNESHGFTALAIFYIPHFSQVRGRDLINMNPRSVAPTASHTVHSTASPSYCQGSHSHLSPCPGPSFSSTLFAPKELLNCDSLRSLCRSSYDIFFHSGLPEHPQGWSSS